MYFVGTEPIALEDERLTKNCIAIKPANAEQTMSPLSRLNFAKVYPIEMNVKVKDLGNVVPNDLANLIKFYREENWLSE